MLSISGTHTESPLAENVAFSSRIQLLVSKFGRSSKPAPRFLVVVRQSVYFGIDFFADSKKTGKAVHIIVNSITKDGDLQTILERKIPLITIKGIAMSSLRDDWMVSAEITLYLPIITHDLLLRF